MRTEPLFNIDNTFPDRGEIKQIREIEKSNKFDPKKKNENGPQNGEKQEKEDEKKPPQNDLSGKLGNELDVEG